MKKIILMILCANFVSNSFAQQKKRNFEYYNTQIDSIISVYSVKAYKSLDDIHLVFHGFNLYADLSVEERKKLIYKVRGLFEQDKYTNLYCVGHELLSEMWDMYPIPNTTEIQQMILELNLRYYFYPYSYNIGISYCNLDDRKCYTRTAKKRMIEILEGKKTKKEYDIFVTFYKSRPTFWNEWSLEEAAWLMKKRPVRNDTVLLQLRDSLLNEHVNNAVKKEFESLQIKFRLVRMIGFLDMKECIPMLKQRLIHSIENRDENMEEAYRYALARLGDREQRQYIWNNLIDIETFDRKDFAYFRDDGLIWHYIEVNYASGKRISVMSDVYLGASLMTMNEIYPYVKNVPEELKYPPALVTHDMKDHYQWANRFYEWLMANKETIEFDYEGEKEWYW